MFENRRPFSTMIFVFILKGLLMLNIFRVVLLCWIVHTVGFGKVLFSKPSWLKWLSIYNIKK